MSVEIINKVTKSGLITIDLEEFYIEGERVHIDIKDQLWQEIALKEKDFREYIKTTNWEEYTNKLVAISCSADAIIPTWAYMLLSSALQPFAKKVVFGSLKDLELVLFSEQLNKINPEEYSNCRVVVKGCGSKPIPEYAYVELTTKLRPFVKSIMYGEPCSTVPIYKKEKLK